MTQKGAIRGVVFDLDGVLIHSAPCHDSAFREVFESVGITNFEYARYAGWRTPEVVADVFRAAGRAASAEQIAALSQAKSRLAREKVAANPGAGDCLPVLRTLSARYRLALASSGSRQSVEAFLDRSGSRPLFSSVLSGEDVENAKPAPEIYEKSFAALDLAGANCVVIEDAVAGVAAAKAAGAQVIGIEGTSPAQALRDSGADDTVGSLQDIVRLLDSKRWTAIVPAAGRGSRLGFDLPKILYPVAGRPILDWLLDFLAPNFSQIVFVLSPSGRGAAEREIERRIPGRYSIAIQEVPTGMGDAVALGLAYVSTPQVAVVWGDQAALRPSSVEACLQAHEGPLDPDVTCPTLQRENPYIHFDRGGDGRISALRQAREGDAMPRIGESDTGFFCFRTAVLRSLLGQLRDGGATRSARTGEFNFLPVIPLAAQSGLNVITPRVVTIEETVGVNSKGDAAALEAYLRRAHAS